LAHGRDPVIADLSAGTQNDLVADMRIDLH
jgi:hypothetical protein